MHDDIVNALKILQEGGVILYPTDTIWGIGCDATNEAAVKRIFEIKKREDSKALLLLIDSPARLNGYVEEVPGMAWDLVELTTKPLTIIYPQGRNLAKNLLAGDGSVGIRITQEAFSHKLCERFRRPIVSTSANISSQPAPEIFSEISPEITEAVDYVVKYRQDDTTRTQPSGILKLGAGGEITVIRE